MTAKRPKRSVRLELGTGTGSGPQVLAKFLQGADTGMETPGDGRSRRRESGRQQAGHCGISCVGVGACCGFSEWLGGVVLSKLPTSVGPLTSAARSACASPAPPRPSHTRFRIHTDTVAAHDYAPVLALLPPPCFVSFFGASMPADTDNPYSVHTHHLCVYYQYLLCRCKPHPV